MCTESVGAFSTVAEYFVSLKKLIVKLTEGINSIYIGISNTYNVKIIIALYLRVALLYNLTKCNSASNFYFLKIKNEFSS